MFSGRTVWKENYSLEEENTKVQESIVMADQQKDKKPDLGLLEEDDEFEEFPAEDWMGAEEDADDDKVWEDNWDDDNIEDDFSKQLRAELEKRKVTSGGSEPMKT